jgi:hypothetical protein
MAIARSLCGRLFVNCIDALNLWGLVRLGALEEDSERSAGWGGVFFRPRDFNALLSEEPELSKITDQICVLEKS